MLAQSPVGHGGYARGFYRRGMDNAYDPGDSDYSDFNRNHFRAIKDDSFDGMEDATKLSYYSPRIEGLQLGASYAPNNAHDGFTIHAGPGFDFFRLENMFSFGANYSQDFDNLGVEISATAEKAHVNNSRSVAGFRRENLFSYDVGTTISYFGFSVGASYGSWGKSLQPKNGVYSCDYDSSLTLAAQTCSGNVQKFSNPYYYTLGLAYQFGPVATSITNIKSTFQKNIYEAVSLGLDYKLTRDLMPYFELTKFTFTSNQPSASDITNQNAIASSQRQIRNNQGYVFLTGILYSF